MLGGKFADTNIFVYGIDKRDLVKKTRANALLTELRSQHSGVSSYQVVQEFMNVAPKQALQTAGFSRIYKLAETTFDKFEIVWPSFRLFDDAERIHLQYKFHWYDSLIVAAAVEARCDTLYTEDLQHGQQLEGLTIINPFL